MNPLIKRLTFATFTLSGWMVAFLSYRNCRHLEQRAREHPLTVSPISAATRAPDIERTDLASFPAVDDTQPPQPAEISAEVSPHEDTEDSSVPRRPIQQSSAEWHADRLMAGLDELTYFDEPSRKAVRDVVVRQQNERYSKSIRFDEELRRVLGEQGADLEQRMAEREQLLRSRERERERAALAHQLQLSSDQEAKVASVLDRVDTLLAPARARTERLIDDAMQQHMAPTTERTRLREAMTIIEQSQASIQNTRKEALANELRSILSADQYKAWLNEASKE